MGSHQWGLIKRGLTPIFLIRDAVFQTVLESSEIDVRNTASLPALVAAGVGITTLPRLAIPAGRADVIFRPAADPDAQRTIGTVTPANRTLPPAAAGFITYRQVEGIRAWCRTSRHE